MSCVTKTGLISLAVLNKIQHNRLEGHAMPCYAQFETLNSSIYPLSLPMHVPEEILVKTPNGLWLPNVFHKLENEKRVGWRGREEFKKYNIMLSFKMFEWPYCDSADVYSISIWNIVILRC
jgi:hypothetical protein